MGKEIMRRIRRRIAMIVALICISAFVLSAYSVYGATLLSGQKRSGWTLFIIILLLAAYGLRKRLAFLPIGNASSWLRFHYSLGLLGVLFFLCHLRFSPPSGYFETTLAGVFVLVTLSGIFGLFISRLFPRKISLRGPEVLFERIPRYSRAIQEKIETLVVEAVKESESDVLASWYRERLVLFLTAEARVWPHLMESRRDLLRLKNEIDALRATVTRTEGRALELIEELIEQKDSLNHAYAHQLILKYWPFLHVPLTWALIILSLVHVVVIYSFSGGLE
jgi:hypothetical protein